MKTPLSPPSCTRPWGPAANTWLAPHHPGKKRCEKCKCGYCHQGEVVRPVREGFLEEVTSKRRSGMGQETAYKWGWGRALQEEGRAEAWALCATHPSSPGPTWKAARESSLCPGLGSVFSAVVSVGAEHRPDFITTVTMVSAPQGGALWTPLGGFQGAQGWRLRGVAEGGV